MKIKMLSLYFARTLTLFIQMNISNTFSSFQEKGRVFLFFLWREERATLGRSRPAQTPLNAPTCGTDPLKLIFNLNLTNRECTTNSHLWIYIFIVKNPIKNKGKKFSVCVLKSK